MHPNAGVPAAHSMDSTWWCVDETGEVAEMTTGEPGAFPRAPCLAEGEAAGDAFDDEAIFTLRSYGAAKALDRLTDEELATLDDRLDTPSAWAELVWVGEPGAAVPEGFVIVPLGRRTYAVSDGSKAPRPEGGLALAAVDDVLEMIGGYARYEAEDYEAPYQYVRKTDGKLLASELPPRTREQVEKLRLPVRIDDHPQLDLKGLVPEGFDAWYDPEADGGETAGAGTNGRETETDEREAPEDPNADEAYFARARPKPPPPTESAPTASSGVRPIVWLLVIVAVVLLLRYLGTR